MPCPDHQARRQATRNTGGGKAALAALGPLTGHERIVRSSSSCGGTLGVSGTLGLDSRRSRSWAWGPPRSQCHHPGDIGKQGDVLATFIWFAVLFTLSSQLNALGFMEFVGGRLAGALGDLATPTAGLILVVGYILLHYLFVSQTAHLLALFGVFLDVGVKLGVNPVLLTFQLLFATNYFSLITPQGSSANLLFAGSGYLTQGDLYRLGAITTGVSALIYFVVGTAWLLLVVR
jgi:DASS family divalent anion:Na+ symporter